MVISESPSSFVVMTASISVTDTGLVIDITETPLLTSVIVVTLGAVVFMGLGMTVLYV